jgi:hypothetical protein
LTLYAQRLEHTHAHTREAWHSFCITYGDPTTKRNAMTKSEQESAPTYDLFMGTVDVINEAIEENADKPVVKNVIDIADKLASGKQFGVAVYKEDPDKPFDYFTVRLQDKKVQLAARGKESPDIAWKVSQHYLATVCDNPRRYIDNPARLDLDWLKSRIAA